MRNLYLVFAILLTGIINAQVKIGNTTYTTLDDAIHAVTTGSHAGAVEILIMSDLEEYDSSILSDTQIYGTDNLPPAQTSVVIKPFGGPRTIHFHGNNALRLWAVRNVTVDGTDGLTIISDNYTCIDIYKDCWNINIKNCKLFSSGSSAVSISSPASLASQDITVQGCEIGNYNGSTLRKGISMGNFDGSMKNLVITGNKIHDISHSSNTIGIAAIDVSGRMNGLSITANKIYQTQNLTTASYTGIAVNLIPEGSAALTISGNFIGYSSAAVQGIMALSTQYFSGISVSSNSSSNEIKVYDNQIKNISITGSGLNPQISMIEVRKGKVAVNTNIIGSSSESNNISFNLDVTGTASVHGISKTDVDNVALNANFIGGISLSGTGRSDFYGIRINTANSVYNSYICYNNTVGGDIANSILNSTIGDVFGIFTEKLPGTMTGNSVRNLSGKGSGIGTYKGVVGILSQRDDYDVNSISYNNVSTLTNTCPSDAARTVGIYRWAGDSKPGDVHNNKVYNLQCQSVNPNSLIVGIYSDGMATNTYNNMVGLTTYSGSAAVYGMFYNNTETYSGNGLQFVNNSIYLGGTQNGSSISAAYYQTGVSTGFQNYNNIYVNDRIKNGTSGIGTPYSIKMTVSNTIFKANVYYGTGFGYVLGSSNSGDKTTLAAWNSWSSSGNSGFVNNPRFVSTSMTTPDLHIRSDIGTIIEGNGYGGLLLDADYQTRADFTPHDIGADAGNFITIQSPVITAVVPPNSFCVGGPNPMYIYGTSLGSITELKIGNTVYPLPQIASDNGGLTEVLRVYPTIAASGLVKVTTPAGIAFSSDEVTIGALPVITIQPQNTIACGSQGTTMSVTATNAGIFQWRHNGVNLSNDSTFSGVNSSTLSITNTTVANQGNYDVVVTNNAGGCSTTSAQAVLTIGSQDIFLSASAPLTQCAGGSVTLTPMKDVPALQFDGIDDSIDQIYSTADVFYESMSMDFWMKTTQTAPTGPNWYNGNGLVDASGQFNGSFGTALLGDKVAFGIDYDNNAYDYTVVSNTAVNTGEWIHVVITRQQVSGEVKIYLNGTLDNSFTPAQFGVIQFGGGYRLGGTRSSPNYFAGSLDNIRIWNRMLTNEEIADLGDNTTAALQTGLIQHYDFEEGSGSTTKNKVSNVSMPLLNGVSWTTRRTRALYGYYFWSNGAQTPTITVTQSGQYTLAGYDTNCPNISNTVAVEISSPEILIFSATNSHFSCINSTGLTLTAEGAETYTWSPATGLNTTTGETVEAHPVVNTLYTVTGTAASGCQTTQSIIVMAVPVTQLTATAQQTILPSNSSTTLTAGGGNGDYFWTPATGLSSQWGDNVIASPTQTTTYTLTAPGNPCATPASVTVTILPEFSLVDNALNFDGIDDFVSLPVQSSGISENFTVAVWVKPMHPTKAMHIFSSRNGSNNATFDIQLLDGNKIHADIGNGTSWLTTQADAEYFYQPNTWMHIAYQVSPGQFNIFVNGNLVKTGYFDGIPVLSNTTNFITLGKSESENTFFQGSLDDLNIYPNSFPLETMMNLPKFNLPGAANFSFDQGIASGENQTVTLLRDKNAFGNFHGTLHNFALSGELSNWAEGQVTQEQIITFESVAPISYGNTAVLQATSTSGLAVEYESLNPDRVMISLNDATAIDVAPALLIARQPGNAFYFPAEASQIVDVFARSISLSNALVTTKVYDHMNSAQITGTLQPINGDDISLDGGGTFASANAGTNIEVVPALSLTGPDSYKYFLVQPVDLTGNITPKQVSVINPVAANKVYDGNTSAIITSGGLSGIIAPAAVSVNGGGTFASAAVGTNIAVSSALVLSGTDAPNYLLLQPVGLSANITPFTFAAVLSGTAAICSGSTADLNVAVSGYTGLMNVVYSDGIQNFTVTGLLNGTAIQVTPTASVTYSLVSVSIPNAQVSVSGSAVISMLPTTTYYADADGDTFGSPLVSLESCMEIPFGYVTNDLDCDDSDSNKHQTFPFYADTDADSFGAGSFISVCAVNATSPPNGYAVNNTDCAPLDATKWQSAELYVDADSDGYTASSSKTSVCYGTNIPAGFIGTSLGIDCNDTDASKHDSFGFYADEDGDTFGAGSLESVCAVNATTPPTGYAANNTDCDPSDAGHWRSATLYVDADFDTYSSGATLVVCYGASIPAGFVATATAIDCNDSVFAINPGHAEVLYNGVDDNCDNQLDEGNQLLSKVITQQCGITLAAINSVIQVISFANITQYRYRVVKIVAGNPIGSAQIFERAQPYFSFTNMASYDYASTYSITVEMQRNNIWLGYSGPSCQVSTPPLLDNMNGAGSINASQCGITIPTIATLIATPSLQSVTAYKFRVTNVTDSEAPGQVQEIERTQNYFALTMLPNYFYGTTYHVEVAVKTNDQFSGYGAACPISSPEVPMINNCEQHMSQPVNYISTASLNKVTSTRFEVSLVDSNDNPVNTFTVDRTLAYFNFNMVPDFVPGGKYMVRVALRTSGYHSPFGEACFVYAPILSRHSADFKPEEIDSRFDAKVFPNPYTESFSLDFDSTSEENVQVSVYDMIGKLIEERNFGSNEIELAQFGEKYPSGVYTVVLSQGGNVKTLRVIKR